MMILNESTRDDLLIPYVEILNSKGIKCTTGILKKWLLRHLTENGALRNLSLASNFYLAGAARYYFNGDLTTNKNLAVFDETNRTTDVWKEDVCTRLNALILILRNSVIDSVGTTFEQPEDFGELSLPKLLRKYGAKINKELGIGTTKKRKEVVDTTDRTTNVGNGYTFEILYSYDDATKYYRPTSPGSWCITYGKGHYDGYVRRLGIHYVIFRKDGWENVKRVKGPGWTEQKPQDEYGCSLIAVLQSNTDGEPIYITSRWNHGHIDDDSHCEADHAFSKEEFFQKTGVTDADLQRIFEIWKKDKPKTRTGGGQSPEVREEKLRVLRCFKYAQMRINGGENPDSVLIKTTSTDPQAIEREREFSKLVIVGNGKPSKSIIVYKSKIADSPYYLLVDRGKILFDTITSEENYSYRYWRKTFDYSERTNDLGDKNSEFKWLKNAIVISLPNEKYMIYDVRRRKYVDIGGVTKFKYLDKMYRTYGVENPMFYEIKMSSNQIALVDINTNQPLMLPNGEYWFESLSYDGKNGYWGRDIRISLIDKKCGFILLMYDSASSEFYVYNISNKKFLNIDTTEFRGTGQYVKNLPVLGSNDFCIIGNDRYPSHSKTCKIFKGDDIVSINGETVFNQILLVEGKYLRITSVDPDSIYGVTKVWSLDDESFICDKNGPIIVSTSPIYQGEYNNALFIRVTHPDDRDGENRLYYGDPRKFSYIVYMPELKSILKNPLDGTNLFVTGGGVPTDSDSINVCTGETRENKVSLSFDDLINGGHYEHAIVPGSAKMEVVNNNNTQNTIGTELNEKFEITNEDIRNMVYEAINKIIK